MRYFAIDYNEASEMRACLKGSNYKSEGFEWISNRDLVDSAHLLMGGIDLDPK